MTVLADLRYSARSFTRTPGLTVALLLSVALGIGSNASVYGFVRGLIAHDSPHASVDRIVSLFAREAYRAAGPVSYEDYLSLAAEKTAFEWLGVAHESQGTIARGDRFTIMSVAAVSPEVAALLNLSLDDGAVISHRVWLTELHGKTDLGGDPIAVDGVHRRLRGVAPEWLEGLYVGRAVDIWVPFDSESLQEADRESRTFWVFGRLRRGVSIDAAQAALNVGAGGTQIGVVRYTGMTPEMADGLGRVGTLLSLAAGAVLFIACANVASFLLGRAFARSRETSIRIALGVSRGRLASQLVSDTVFISMAGAAIGALLAVWTSNVVPAFFFQEDAERLIFSLDRFGIAAACAVCVAVTIACGLTPLLAFRHDRPATVLQRESQGPSKVIQRLRAGLVIGQITCCCVLVISAARLVQGLETAMRTTVGHRLDQAIVATVQTAPERGLEYFENIERAALSTDGISGTAWTARLPGARPVWQSFRIEPARPALRDVTIDVAAFGPDSLGLIALPPIAGRLFGARDTAQSCRVAVVNEEAASDMFGSDPIGRTVEDVSGRSVEIIGAVATRKKKGTIRNRPTIYYYVNQHGSPAGPANFRVPVDSNLATAVLDAHIVSAGYFDAMGLLPVAGQIFSIDPTRHPCRAAVVNQEAAEQYFGGNAVGAAVIDGLGRRTEIAGVVHSAPLRAIGRRVDPAIYFPMAEDFIPRMTLIVAALEANEATLGGLRRSLEAVPGAEKPPVVRTLDDHLRRTGMAPLRIAAVLVAAFAAVALALGILGLYGALTDAARQRRREIAVRILLGAQSWRLIRQVIGEGGRLAAAGTIAGMLASVLVAGLLVRIAPGTGAPSLWVWAAAPLVSLGAVAIASVVPAYRALSVDPLTITRDDK